MKSFGKEILDYDDYDLPTPCPEKDCTGHFEKEWLDDNALWVCNKCGLIMCGKTEAKWLGWDSKRKNKIQGAKKGKQ